MSACYQFGAWETQISRYILCSFTTLVLPFAYQGLSTWSPKRSEGLAEYDDMLKQESDRSPHFERCSDSFLTSTYQGEVPVYVERSPKNVRCLLTLPWYSFPYRGTTERSEPLLTPSQGLTHSIQVLTDCPPLCFVSPPRN